MGYRSICGDMEDASIPDPPPVTATILSLTENPWDMLCHVGTEEDWRFRGTGVFEII
jgi:hypothetical protein